MIAECKRKAATVISIQQTIRILFYLLLVTFPYSCVIITGISAHEKKILALPVIGFACAGHLRTGRTTGKVRH